MAIQHKGGVLDYPENYSIGISSSTHASLCARYSLSLAFIGDKEPMGCQIVSERYHQEFPQGQKLLSENILRWTWISWPSGLTYLKVPPKKKQSNNSWKIRTFLVYLFCGFCGVLSLVMWKVLTSRGFCGCFDDWQNHPGTRANQWHFNSTFLGKALSCAFLDTQVSLAPTLVSP